MSGGGAVALCLERLDSWIGNWRDHLEKSGCGWVIEVIVALRNEGSASVVEAILEGHRVLEHLKALQLPGDFFSLHETKDEALCLLCENRRWVIFYSERGTRSGLQAYESAAEAHAAFLESIQKMTGIS